jgi:hypothetical protein
MNMANLNPFKTRHRSPRSQPTTPMEEETVAPEQTTLPRRHLILNKLSIFAILWFVAFLLLYHAVGDAKSIGWQNAYYFWDKSCDLLFFVILYFAVPKQRSVIIPVIIYTSVRLCFQITTIIWGIDTNATRIVNTLYLILTGVFIIECIKELARKINEACQRKY